MPADDTPAGDLDEAERLVRQFAETGQHPGRPAVAAVLAEYDRRAQEIEQLKVRAQQHANATSWSARQAVDHMRTADDLTARLAAVRALAHGWSELADEAESPTAQAHMQGYEIWEAVGEASAYRHAVRGVLAALDGQEVRHA